MNATIIIISQYIWYSVKQNAKQFRDFFSTLNTNCNLSLLNKLYSCYSISFYFNKLINNYAMQREDIKNVYIILFL